MLFFFSRTFLLPSYRPHFYLGFVLTFHYNLTRFLFRLIPNCVLDPSLSPSKIEPLGRFPPVDVSHESCVLLCFLRPPPPGPPPCLTNSPWPETPSNRLLVCFLSEFPPRLFPLRGYLSAVSRPREFFSYSGSITSPDSLSPPSR